MAGVPFIIFYSRIEEGSIYSEGGGVLIIAFVTIDHVSLIRRSTIPTSNRHVKLLGARYVFRHITFRLIVYLLVSPSVATIFPPGYGNRLPATIFVVYQTSPSDIRPYSSLPPLAHPVTPRDVHIITMCWLYRLLPCHKGTTVHLLSPLHYWYTSSFWQVRVLSPGGGHFDRMYRS